MRIECTGKIWFWRGPAPWYFVTVPEAESHAIKAISASVTYGWGVIPVRAEIGATSWTTSLFPKGDCYLVPVKASIRRAEQIDEGDTVTIQLDIGEDHVRPDR